MRFDSRRAGGGMAIAATWIAAMYAVAPITDTFPPIEVAQALIFSAPGWLSTWAIDRFGFYAQSVLVIAVTIGFIVSVGLIAGALPNRPPFGERVLIALATLVTGGLFLAGGTAFALGFGVGMIIAVGLPYAIGRALADVPPRRDRRAFLQEIAGVGILTLTAVAILRGLFGLIAGTGDPHRVQEPLARSIDRPTGDTRFDFDGMPRAVTPPGDHYVVDINISNPRIDPATWSLDIQGAVEHPYTLSYDELLDHPSSVEQTVTMICISNPVGGDLIGTGHWTGVPLRALIEPSVPTDNAVCVVTHAVDGYSEAIPLSIVDREDILVAYGMGERTLAVEHGFPARLVIPGRYGMKMTKWIDRIELVTEEHEAYWEARGWNARAIVNTMAYIRGAVRSGDVVTIGGVAFGGLETGIEEIAGVEVSLDDGASWTKAEIEPTIDVHAWRRWRIEVRTVDTELSIVCRAIRRDGSVQTGREQSPHPDGATGWHRRTIRI